MGDLRDQLKKAKILSEKKARQLAHEERVHRKAVSHEGLEREETERLAEIEQVQSAVREHQQHMDFVDRWQRPAVT